MAGQSDGREIVWSSMAGKKLKAFTIASKDLKEQRMDKEKLQQTARELQNHQPEQPCTNSCWRWTRTTSVAEDLPGEEQAGFRADRSTYSWTNLQHPDWNTCSTAEDSATISWISQFFFLIEPGTRGLCILCGHSTQKRVLFGVSALYRGSRTLLQFAFCRHWPDGGHLQTTNTLIDSAEMEMNTDKSKVMINTTGPGTGYHMSGMQLHRYTASSTLLSPFTKMAAAWRTLVRGGQQRQRRWQRQTEYRQQKYNLYLQIQDVQVLNDSPPGGRRSSSGRSGWRRWGMRPTLHARPPPDTC